MEIQIAPFRMLFKEPFGTSHGSRDGTDSVLIRVGAHGHWGYGESTMPPYIAEDQLSVISELKRYARSIDLSLDAEKIMMLAARHPGFGPACRAGLISALKELIYKEKGVSFSTHLGSRPGTAMITLGQGAPEGYAKRITELPAGFPLLKIKLGTVEDRAILEAVLAADDRPLVLDANQGWSGPDQVAQLLAGLPIERFRAIEQPFPKDRWELHKALKTSVPVPLIADESVQGLEDMDRAAEAFDGVNLKLMKCGGLDVAQAMAKRAKANGLEVMLGSMSESSLGCAAMLGLAPLADLVDLDGPWLLRNDPFQGMALAEGRLLTSGQPGYGVEPRPEAELHWSPIGA